MALGHRIFSINTAREQQRLSMSPSIFSVDTSSPSLPRVLRPAQRSKPLHIRLLVTIASPVPPPPLLHSEHFTHTEGTVFPPPLTHHMCSLTLHCQTTALNRESLITLSNVLRSGDRMSEEGREELHRNKRNAAERDYAVMSLLGMTSPGDSTTHTLQKVAVPAHSLSLALLPCFQCSSRSPSAPDGCSHFIC
ncbi:unnamed protein product [Pleuronectes platessa]|uniref:Uncharacterized protein n=1 Tax=Pleuronectes platessa TaxID=8262 RepID=A0A9N7UZY2_PLEPL|nr:unnamed protein product [Pleuronectes platessa]